MVSVLMLGDTANISGSFLNPSLGTSISVAGLGAASLTDKTQIFSNVNTGFIGIGDITRNLGLFHISTPDSFNLGSNFGPVFSQFVGVTTVENIPTDHGPLTLGNFSDVTFTATLTSTPEPSGAISLLVGMALLVFRRRNQRPR